MERKKGAYSDNYIFNLLPLDSTRRSKGVFEMNEVNDYANDKEDVKIPANRSQHEYLIMITVPRKKEKALRFYPCDKKYRT